MENKDTKYMDLNTTLSAVGKAVFVNFYYDFKNETLSDNEITIKLLKENPGSKSNNQNFRIRRARHIFNEENQLDALKIVINSKKISIETRNKAKKILDEELQRIYTFQEAVEEREFIEKFNENIVYSEQHML